MADPRMPIAIVGASCRFPGGANNLEDLWRVLTQVRNVWSDVPAERFNWEAFDHPHPEASGAHNHRGGHFLDHNIAAFDAKYWGISSSEAQAIDPQQRIQLETAYEALENAGLPLENLRGSLTGVFIAVFNHDYDRMMYKDTSDLPKYLTTGTGPAIASNRISYLFDLKGPSITLDTGCSGSMVALHLACQSLRSKETDLALAGGTNLILSPDVMIAMSTFGMLNRDGLSYPFDARGSGYGRGEGAATVVLKRLDDALQSGDPIRALIRDTIVGQDGKTAGITLPSMDARVSLMNTIYQRAGIDPKDTLYVEAHGTGTVAGDTAEMEALRKVFAGDKRREKPCLVGSIKANIGHLESASGIAGLIKAMLILEKAIIPGNPNLSQLKSSLDLESWKMNVSQENIAWPNGCPRRVSVNSFGYGGTNAHAILEHLPWDLKTANFGHTFLPSAPLGDRLVTPGSHTGTSVDTAKLSDGSINIVEVNFASGSRHDSVVDGITHASGGRTDNYHKFSYSKGKASKAKQDQSMRLLPVFAKSEVSLCKMLCNLRIWISSYHGSENRLKDLAYTFSSRRTLMPWRHSIVIESRQDLLSSLKENTLKMNKVTSAPQLVFIFTGQGAQWHAMGRELLLISSCFRRSISESTWILQGLGAPWSLLDELLRDKSTSRVTISEFGQPATTALQIALVDLLREWKILPCAVLGHSSGEIAAAYAAGAITHELALRLSYHRSFLSIMCNKKLHIKGAMLAIALGERDILKYIPQLRDGRVVVACVNSPLNTIVSGDEDGIAEFEKMCCDLSIQATRLKVDTAYHSHHMEAVSDEYLHALGDLESEVPASPPSIDFFSSVLAARKSSNFNPSYWVENLTSKVRFSEALLELSHKRTASAQGVLAPELLFVEIGPHSTLMTSIRQTLGELSSASFRYSYQPSLERYRSAERTLLELSAKLFEKGHQFDLNAVNNLNEIDDQPAVVKDLMPYPWDHSQTHWYESRLSTEHRQHRYPVHDLLGRRAAGSSILEPSWSHIMTSDELPWLREHVIDNTAIFPASGFICMAIEAIRQIAQERRTPGLILNYVLHDVAFLKALVIPDLPSKIEVQLSLRSSEMLGEKGTPVAEYFRILSIDSDGLWHEHCHGFIMLEFAPKSDDEAVEEEDYLTMRTVNNRLNDVSDESVVVLEPYDLYQELKLNGNYYGPTFAAIKSLKVCKGDALGIIGIPDVARIMPANFLQPHVIHPTTLDAIIHTSLPLYAQQCAASSILTTAIRELVVSASVENVPAVELQVVTSVIPSSQSETANVLVSQHSPTCQEQLVVQITDVELQGTGYFKSGILESLSNQDIVYRMIWDTDIDFYTPSSQEMPQKDALNDPFTPLEKLQLLNTASSIYIQTFFDQLPTWVPDGLEGHWLCFFDWMSHYRVSQDSQSLTDTKSQANKDACLRKARAAGLEGEMLCRIGSRLTSFFVGELDPLAIMLDGDLLFQLYADDSSSRCYSSMATYMNKLLFKHPFLRVLEIGAGTGGATVPLFRSQSQDKDLLLGGYDFTDISPGFFEAARSRLKEWESTVQYKVLDIARDPVEQGFTEASYDVIIASNALHVTSSIDNGLRNTRRLLKPGGRLLMVETVQIVPFHNIIFGVLPGWWLGKDDGRKDSPLLSVDQWNSALLRNGLNGVDVVAKDFDDPAHRSAMLVSQAVPQSETPILRPIVFLRNAMAQLALSSLAGSLNTVFQEHGLQTSSTHWSLLEPREDALFIVVDNAEKPLLLNQEAGLFLQITRLLTRAKNVIWITAQDQSQGQEKIEAALLEGFIRTARMESEGSELITIQVHDGFREEVSGFCQKTLGLVYKLFFLPNADLARDCEYIFQKGAFLIPRLIPDETLNHLISHSINKPQTEMQLLRQENLPLKLHLETPNISDSVRFVHDKSFERVITADEIEIQIEACSLGLNDALTILGKIRDSLPTSGGCGGTVTRIGAEFLTEYKVGDRVIAWGGMMYSNTVRIHGSSTHHLSDKVSFAMGSLIPASFGAAYYALVEVTRVEKGQAILIHNAADYVGQAALGISKHLGLEIFATVKNDSERQVLASTFHLQHDHIIHCTFRKLKRCILKLTHGRGVNVLLNVPSGGLLSDRRACVAMFGYIIDVGLEKDQCNKAMTKELRTKQVTYSSVDFGLMCRYQPEKSSKILDRVMSMFDAGVLTPIKLQHVMPMSSICQALRLLQSGTITEPVILESWDDTIVPVQAPKTALLKLRSNATYLIAGGLGGLGRAVARMMATRGAKHIVTLSRSTPNLQDREKFRDELRSLGAEVQLITCDITDKRQVQALYPNQLHGLPPVKGIVQAAMVLQDCVLENMTLQDFNVPLRAKIDGTRFLDEAFKAHCPDFFVMLSSCSGILGNSGQANYAAGNTFQDAFANTQMRLHTHYTSIDLGPVKDAGAVSQSSSLERHLIRRGFIPVEVSKVLTLVEYSMSDRAKQDQSHQIILGFNKRSMTDSKATFHLRNPMLRRLRPLPTDCSTEANQTDAEQFAITIARSPNIEETHGVIFKALATKFVTLVSSESVELHVPLTDYGFDSLVGIELKNWIKQTFQSSLQTSEIVDMPNLIVLAGLVAERSSLLVGESDIPPLATNTLSEAGLPKEQKSLIPLTASRLPKQPLPGLDETLDTFLVLARPVSSEQEYRKTQVAVQEFRELDRLGRQLQQRLVERYRDPRIENWLSDLIGPRRFLASRIPLVPFSNYFGSHYLSAKPHSTAERAAVISIAAFQFKKRLGNGEAIAHVMNEQELDPSMQHWLFMQVDQVQKFPDNDYIIVLRRGHFFKTALRESDGDISFNKLRSTFQHILDTAPDEMSRLGVLTADERAPWHEWRDKLKHTSHRNKISLRTIEAASFLVCLDEGRPETSSQGALQFMLGDGSNRWNDKSLQFVVCDNGISGLICEHALIDGLTVAPLNGFVTEAILAHESEAHIDWNQESTAYVEQVLFELSVEVKSRISQVHTAFQARAEKCTFAGFDITSLSPSFLRDRKIPPRSGIQIAIQLALRRYFGFSPSSFEAVSMAHFCKGRVESHHVLRPEVARFCDASVACRSREPARSQCDDSRALQVDREQRLHLLQSALKTHAKSLHRASAGYGINRHCLALEWMLRDEELESKPALFTDPVYERLKPLKAMTDSMAIKVLESGLVFPFPESFWTHFDLKEDTISFSLWGNDAPATRLQTLLEEAATEIRELLE